MPSSIRRFVPAVGAVVLAVVLTACSGSGSMPGTDHAASGMTGEPTGTAASGSAAPTGSNAGRAGDVMFAQMMVPHHQQAVEMADIALGKQSASAQVRQLATQIKAGQDPEIETMRGWLQSWGAPLPTTGMSHDGMGGTSGQGMMTQADMDALKAADGAEFDKQWVTMMTAHHEGAITMARQVLTTTQNPDVKTLAEAVVKAQTEEIATMKGLS
ncbi:DUF305 domain-containing protein [Terrabacter terrae]|uniref:DUF305 domain-containing protein n=1 Tax=Terrabacter terrae TaxID=318434 RepID=A0ABN2U1Y6_9MICO